MPRPRKYDPSYDLPITLFLKVPIHLINTLESKGISRSELEKMISKEKVLVNFIDKIIKNN